MKSNFFAKSHLSLFQILSSFYLRKAMLFFFYIRFRVKLFVSAHCLASSFITDLWKLGWGIISASHQSPIEYKCPNLTFSALSDSPKANRLLFLQVTEPWPGLRIFFNFQSLPSLPGQGSSEAI